MRIVIDENPLALRTYRSVVNEPMILAPSSIVYRRDLRLTAKIFKN